MPVTQSLESMKPLVHEQILELQNKIQLLEGDRKAFYESNQWAVKKNRESILQLRQGNKDLHKKLAGLLTGDEKIIKEAFQDRTVEQAAMRNKSREVGGDSHTRGVGGSCCVVTEKETAKDDPWPYEETLR
uniref:Uncharacterized protein n=1 Tax=Sphenodon punctatus TaxID=8508 RepID=A0A8D0G8I7_SPHPU